MYTGLHAKYQVFLLDFNDTSNTSKVLEKLSNIKFHENPSSGSRAVPCEQTDRYTNGDIIKLTVTFCNFINAPKTHN
jgi:hypothetical protein